MKTNQKRLICFVLLLAMLLSCIPFASFADEAWEPQVITGTYSYTSNEGEINQHGTDTFVYRDDCFMQSSYIGCTHLMTLSAQTAIASASSWGENVDPAQSDDPTENAANIVQLLVNMGFSDVSTNKYYTLEKQENSAAVAVGRRTIVCDKKTYTLLAVIPRSANYKQEWVGNFTVGNGDYHDGFKQGRDEILRYVKKYLTEHEITGDLKVWITGHSRGAALSNALGGFFAGGGASYFGNVSLTPEDVYCYTFATPKTVKETVSKKEYLSVSGPRADTVYAGDTQVEGYVYSEDGTLDVHDKVFNGIRNYPLPYDFITMLPPELWGFTYFGRVESSDDNGKVTVEEMLEELRAFAPFAYEKYVNGGDYRSFAWKTFDFPSLSVANDTAEHTAKTIAEFMTQRIYSLADPMPTSEIYVSEKFEETLKSVAGLYGMLHSFSDLDVDVKEMLGEIIKPLALCYIAYGRDQLKAEGRLAAEATDEDAAIALITDLLSFVTGAEVSLSATFDEVVVLLLNYLVENEGSKLWNTAIGKVAELLPSDGFAASALEGIFVLFVKDPETAIKEEKIASLVKAFVRDPEEGTQAYQMNEASVASGNAPDYTPQAVRNLIYLMLAMVNSDLAVAVNNGSATLPEFAPYLLKLLLVKEKDEDGKPVSYYSTIDEGANALLAGLLTTVVGTAIEKQNKKYGELFDQQLKNHLATLVSDNNLTNLRKLLLPLVLHTDGEPFSASSAVSVAATFYGNIGVIPLAHYNEVNVAWSKAQNKQAVDHAPANVNVDTGVPSSLLPAALLSFAAAAAAVMIVKKKRT